MSTTLQNKFAEALRRALDGSQPGVPTVHVDVQPAAVSIAPRIVAEMPALPQPLLVQDTGREPGAYVYKMTVKRQDGLIVDATLTPQRFIPLGAFE